MPRRALAADQPAWFVEVVVDGESFHLWAEQNASRLVDEVGSALDQGVTLVLPLRDGGTLIINGRTVHSVAVLPSAHEGLPRPRRALTEDQ